MYEIACRTELRIGKDGKPLRANTEDCPTAFATQAKQAATQWRFDPWLEDGKPVRTRYPIVFRFRAGTEPDRVMVSFDGLFDLDLGPIDSHERPTPPEGVVWLETDQWKRKMLVTPSAETAERLQRIYGVPSVSCSLALTLDAEGSVLSAEPWKCPDVLVDEATEAAMRSRFYVDSKARADRYMLLFTYAFASSLQVRQ